MLKHRQGSKNNKVIVLITQLEEKEERILKILERLSKENCKGISIIIEGKKDAEALRVLGIKGKLIEAKTAGKSLLEVISQVERCNTQEVILLLDFDRRGREWTKRLKQYLEKTQIKPNQFFWEELISIVGREVKDIEGLSSYMTTLRKKITNTNESKLS